MKIFFIGDIVGRPGRQLVNVLVPRLVRDNAIDFVIANAENAAGGLGATPKILRSLLSYGVDAITMGNHVWSKKEILDGIEDFVQVIRPANFPDGAPGQGAAVVEGPAGVKVGIVNVLGRVFMMPIECPFRVVNEEIKRLREQVKILIVDFHAEATSEKKAMGYYLDGRISALVGTHTHVMTADETILPGGTAYISDVGMTGPHDSVLGVKKDSVISNYLTRMPVRFEVAQEDPILHGVLIDVDENSGKATNIRRICERMPPDPHIGEQRNE